MFIVLSVIFIAIGIIGILLFDLYELIIFLIEGGSPPYDNWVLMGIQFIIVMILGVLVMTFIFWFLNEAIKFLGFILDFVIKFFNKKK